MIATTAPTAPVPLAWIEMALIIFFAVFVLVVIGVLIRKRGHYDAAAQIPLDDQPTTPANGDAT